jgi:hypothetical protein
MIKTPHNPRTGIQFRNCRFDAGEGAEALKVVEAFIRTKRIDEPERLRSRITKKHNHQFNFINR